MLAMLFEMTWTLSSWAIIPVDAVCIARMFFISWSRPSVRHFGELLDRRPANVAMLLDQRGDLGVGARQFDHARHLDHAAHVGFLDRALHEPDARGRLSRNNALGRAEGRADVFQQAAGLREGDDA